MVYTLEEALERIAQLELENAKLREELQNYRNKKVAGRKKHDEAWTESYNTFAKLYSDGLTIMEIVDEAEISRRTAYRYKKYYDEMRKVRKEEKCD